MKQNDFNLGKSVYEIMSSDIHDFIRYYYKSEHNSDVDDFTLESLVFSTLQIYAYLIKKYGECKITEASIMACLVHDGKSNKDTETIDTYNRLRKELNNTFANTTTVLMETMPGYKIETNDE